MAANTYRSMLFFAEKYYQKNARPFNAYSTYCSIKRAGVLHILIIHLFFLAAASRAIARASEAREW